MKALRLRVEELESRFCLSTLVFEAGVADNFAGRPEPASPSPALKDSVGVPFIDFDQVPGVTRGVSTTVAFGHSFTELAPRITAATLELHVQAGDESGFERTDGMGLEFAGTGDEGWFRFFGTPNRYAGYGSDDPGLFDFLWVKGIERTLTLDLANLPLADGSTVDLIPLLNKHQLLDVRVGDETGVDYMKLTVSTTCATEMDFNKDDVVNTVDIDILGANRDSDDLDYDLDGDGRVGSGDIDYMIANLGSVVGDANLDYEVDFGDFSNLASSFGKAGGWADGDADLNGFINLRDFVLLVTNYGASGTGPFQFPVNNCNPTFFAFGVDNPNLKNGYGHLGQDFNAARGEPVYAVADGTVTFAEDRGKLWDGVVIIEHVHHLLGTVYSFYGHLDGQALPEKGDVVRGQVIGQVGPYDEGPDHLHFEIRSGPDGGTEVGHGYRRANERFPTPPVSSPDFGSQILWYDPLDFLT